MTLESGTPSLENKIDALNHQAWNLRIADSKKSFLISQDSVAQSRKADYKKGLAEGLSAFDKFTNYYNPNVVIQIM